MAELKSKIGLKIKIIRKNKNFTQEKLAEKTGLSVDFISLIERGINAPSIKSMETIAKALSVKVEELVK